MNIKVQTDQEILTDLIQQLIKTNKDDNIKTLLTDLEFYLHQVCFILRFTKSFSNSNFSMIMQLFSLIKMVLNCLSNFSIPVIPAMKFDI